MAQLVRAPPCHGGGRRFESDLGRYGVLAQLGEHLPYKQRVIGSSPITSTSLREWLSGRALPCQGKRREFESRRSLILSFERFSGGTRLNL